MQITRKTILNLSLMTGVYRVNKEPLLANFKQTSDFLWDIFLHGCRIGPIMTRNMPHHICLGDLDLNSEVSLVLANLKINSVGLSNALVACTCDMITPKFGKKPMQHTTQRNTIIMCGDRDECQVTRRLEMLLFQDCYLQYGEDSSTVLLEEPLLYWLPRDKK